MYTRAIPLPATSFFLFGPRGTGKTTWLKDRLTDALWFDLLRTQELLELTRNPDRFRQKVLGARSKRWVVVDEVQKYPALLNDVQALMGELGSRVRFALTGSSARKLKRTEANLLAGRAVNRHLFPLTWQEMGSEGDIPDLLRFGFLPGARNARSEAEKIDFLDAYCANYVREEILQEALVKSLESFSRFLEVAAISNGQTTNVSSIARDAGVARPTVNGYFDVLIDTLIGTWLPAWRPRAKVKERALPKFYFFDPGVARGVAGRAREPVSGDEAGFLLETWILHELRAHMSYANIGGSLYYWKVPSGSEVDFIWGRGKHVVGIEVKATRRWKGEFSQVLRMLYEARKVTKAYGVYLGGERLKDGPVSVLPIGDFLSALSKGEVLRPAA